MRSGGRKGTKNGLLQMRKRHCRQEIAAMAVNEGQMGAMALPAMPPLAPRASIDAASLEQIACAARLLRSIAASDGEIEILVHEMARVLERIVQQDSCQCPAAKVPLAARYAW